VNAFIHHKIGENHISMNREFQSESNGISFVRGIRSGTNR